MTINVALASAPGVFGDLLESVIGRDSEFHLLARYDDPAAMIEMPFAHRPDVVVVSAASRLAMRRLLDAGACDATVAISPDGKDVLLSHRGGPDVRLVDPSPDRLLDSIRSVLS